VKKQKFKPGPSEREKLRAQVATLKRLPRDFRDLDPGGADWEAFAEATGRRGEMDKWLHGPVLTLEPLSEGERRFFADNRVYYSREWTVFERENWVDVLQQAESTGCSWVYLPREERNTIAALNVLLSRFEYNFRVRGQIRSAHTGHPVGVVY